MFPAGGGPTPARVLTSRFRLSIVTKVFIGFLAVAAVFVTASVLGMSRIQSLRRNVQIVREGILPLSDSMGTVRSELKIYQEVLSLPDLNRVKGYLPRFRPFVHVRRLEGELVAVRDRFELDPTAKDLVALLADRLHALRMSTDLRRSLESRLEPAIGQVLSGSPNAHTNEELYDVLARAYVASVDQERRADARELQDEISTIVLRIRNEIAAIRREFRRFIVRIDETARTSEQRTGLEVGVMTGAALLVAIIILVWISRTVRPIQRLRDGTRRVALGDFALVTVQTTDEIGQLAEDFNRMAVQLAERDRQLARQRDELAKSERLAMVGKLSSQISHEIRNPLSSMGLNTELLEDELADLERAAGPGTAKEAQTLARAIRGEIDRLANVTSQYLRLARLPRPEFEVADLNALLTDLLEFMREELARKSIERLLDLDPELPPFPFDPNQLRQSVLNLVRNAVEAMDHGGRLTITTRREGAFARLTVADTGAGIAPGDLEKMFQPFFTTKASGTGLGLALVREILHEHGGAITVESTLTTGTTFLITMPIRRVEAFAAAVADD